MDTTQILITSLLIAFSAAITLFIRKLLFEKNYVKVSELNSIKEECHQLKTQLAVSENALHTAKEESNKVTLLYEAKSKEAEKLYADLAEKTTEKVNLDLDIVELKQEIQNLKQVLEEKSKTLQTANETITNQKAELSFNQEKLVTQKQEVEQLAKKLEDAFKVLAQRILDDKSKKFSEDQERNLKGILEPLQKEIQQFKEDIGAKQKQESDERISLREQVKHMAGLNQTLSEQANKLAETLRLQVKQQGDWGESILEAILENSGLQKDLQYKTQYSTRNDDGKTIRPDIVVNYPDGRKIVIDSKVSLVNYYNMCNSANKEEELKHLKELIKSLKSHMDGLASKNYGDINQALDFIIMFVPVEPAYIAAMHGDPELWQYAYKKGILLISPANLIATLKLVKDMWRKDAVDKNAHEIAEKAGKLYDKLVTFVDNFQRVGLHLDKAKETWTDAFGQLKEGKGNALSWGLKLKALNIQSKKDLPDDLANAAILNDHFGVEKRPNNDIQLYE